MARPGQAKPGWMTEILQYTLRSRMEIDTLEIDQSGFDVPWSTLGQPIR